MLANLTPYLEAEVIKSSLVLVVAAFWDYLIGDPLFLLHPVQVMGWLISRYTNLSFRLLQKPWQQRFSGIILGLSLIIGSGIGAWFLIKLACTINFWFGLTVEISLLASCFAAKSLSQAAKSVLNHLAGNDIKSARSQLSMYVGRDTANLSRSEILRAVLETVGENAVDGITAPLFYAIFGVSLGIGAVPLAQGYKAASTLDSMVGYLRHPYIDIGWFSAQLEDRLTWLPCRLTVLTLAVFSGRPLTVLEICRRDAVLDPSPNSGWSECVYAAVLGVQLGGTNTYQGKTRVKPLLGNSDREISPEIIYEALSLTRYCFLLWLLISILSLLILNYPLNK